MNMKIISSLLLGLILLGCNSKKSGEDTFNMEAYQSELDSWHKDRIEYLKSNGGWLNLAGLYWLKEGISTFGSDESNDIIFPKEKIPAKAGIFLMQKGVVTLTSLPEVEILSNGKPIKTGVVFHPDSVSQPTLSYGSLQWFIIKRDDQYGVRLRDLNSTAVQEFLGIDHYEVNPEFRLEAHLEIPSTPKKIEITNVLGQTTTQDSPGTLVFTYLEKEYRLDALVEDKELFVIFGDPTNESETYPSGRYVYTAMPDEDGKTILDFNKAYNPPCAFTPFATCPLPPSQNVLPVAIRAGEKIYKGYTH
jgi:uncharacterized protein (DUF1684 family)